MEFVDSTPEERDSMSRSEKIKDELRYDWHLLSQTEIRPWLLALVLLVVAAGIVGLF